MSIEDGKILGDGAKALVTATKFLQAEIAKYLGNDGKLSKEEESELEDLRKQLHVDETNFNRLKSLAKQELFYFRRDDIVGYVLGRVDRPKLYLDAERLSIRISLVDRWIQELEKIQESYNELLKEDREYETLEVQIIRWVYQDDWTEKLKKLCNLKFDVPEEKEEATDASNGKKDNGQKNKGKKDKEVTEKDVQELLSNFLKRPTIIAKDEKNEIFKKACGKKDLLAEKDQELIKWVREKLSSERDCSSTLDDVEKKAEELLKGLQDPSGLGYKFIYRILRQEDGYYEKLKQINPSYEGLDPLVLKDAEDIRKKLGIEKKDAPDSTKHFLALALYIICVGLLLFGFYHFQFVDYSHIYSDVIKYAKKKDNRDSSFYNVTKIGNITWMVDNLKFKTDSSIASNYRTTNSGNLYQWKDVGRVCPDGWRVPLKEEWEDLVNQAGGLSVAGKKLKSATTWNNDGNGDNDLGFSALSAGFAAPTYKEAHEEGNLAMWWTYSMSNPEEAIVVKIQANSDSVIFEPMKLNYSLSVRCVRVDNNYVLYRQNPRAERIASVQEVKGTVEYDKDSLPAIKKKRLYEKELYDQLNPVIQQDVSLNTNSNNILTHHKVSKTPMFIQGSSAELKRIYERNYVFVNDKWVPDSTWIQDSVLVYGNYELVDFVSVDNNKCNATFRANVGADTLATLQLNVPCLQLHMQAMYTLYVRFVMKKKSNCNEDCSSVDTRLEYSIVSSEAHQVVPSEE